MTFLQDLRFAARMLLKKPAFSAVVILTLALGIGANTAIFSVVKAVLLEPLPFAEPDRLMRVRRTTAEGQTSPVAPATAVAWRERNTVFESIAFSDDVTYTLTGAGEPKTIFGYYYDVNVLPVLGVQPMLGRNFLPEEDRPGGAPVVLLSHKFWQEQLGADRNIVGKTLTLDGRPRSIIGVMPPGFAYPENSLVWTPLALSGEQLQSHEQQILRVLARLKPGVTREQAETEIRSITQTLAAQHPQIYQGGSAALGTFYENRVGDIEAPLLALWGAVTFVLLIACSNVSGLLLASAAVRRKEFAVRMALGAASGRVVRQLLTESVLLAAAAGAVGFLVAIWTRNALIALVPKDVANLNMPTLDNVPIDLGVTVFVVAVTFASALLFSLAPAIQALRTSPGETLGERSTTVSGRGQSRMRRVLVVSEVALALVLLIGAGLMIRTMQDLQRADLGFDPERVLTLQVSLPNYRYPDEARQRAFIDQALAKMRALPGVEHAGVVSFMPLTGFSAGINVAIEGRDDAPDRLPAADYRNAGPGYFESMRIPLRQGRFFNDFDRPESQQVVIVNESFAKRFFPDGRAVGKRIGAEGLQWQIVGVVADARYEGPALEPQPMLYRPFAQEPFFWASFTLRTAAEDPYAVASAARRVISEVDSDLPVWRTLAMEEMAFQSVALYRGTMLLLLAMAALALLLAVVGVYGLLSFTVVQRTHEIGIRMALGAERSEVLRMVLSSGARLVAIGIAIGLLGAFVVTRVLVSLLHGVSATDPVTYGAVALTLAAAALVASYIPARRATKVDPMVALRYE